MHTTHIFRYIALIGFICMTIVHSSPAWADISASTPKAVKGMMDIRENRMVENSQKIPLHGEWTFYPHQLWTPQDLNKINTSPEYIPVPSAWNSHTFNDEGGSKYGYGTYRLTILIPARDVGRNKALFLQTIGSAYRIWVDGIEKSGLGTVGTSLHSEQPQSHIDLIFFQPEHETIELVLQISNFSFREGGITREVIYGDTKALIPYVLKKLLYDIFVISGFLMIALYHFIVYGMRKNDPSTLFVGLVALAISLRTLFLNVYLTSLLLRLDQWEVIVKLEYISELAILAAAIFLMRSLFANEVHRILVVISLVITAGLFLFVIATPVRIFTETMIQQTIVKAVLLLYFICFVGIRAYLRKREGALIHLAALCIIFAALVNDMLYYMRIIKTVEILDYSIVPFILAQAAIVSYRYSRLSRKNKMLIDELSQVNSSLESIVEKRTERLHETNQQLQIANHQLLESKEMRTKMLVNIAHDLGTPLVGIQTYLQLMSNGKYVSQPREITEQLLDKTIYLRRLINDLFELAKLESRQMVFQLETIRVHQWLTEIENKFRRDLANEGMTLRMVSGGRAHSLEQISVRIDPMRMMQVMQNYIDNAVKFSKGISQQIEIRGYARHSASDNETRFVVEVIDQGMGITEDEKPHVFERFFKKRDHNEEGSGLGLAIVKEIVEQHQGTVGVKSNPQGGSTFYLDLPAQLIDT